MHFDESLYSFLLLIFSFLVYRWYINWRKFKKKVYGHNKLKVWDYRLLLSYWGVIVISVMAALIFFLKAIVE